MTTKNVVVADGSKEGKGEKSPAEIRGLVQVKANELVERIGKSLELGVVLDGMQRLIDGLDIAEEMVYT
ncbi:MAG: hypothetical protein NTY04_01365, partial [Candidatus Staskawiczbacteria bacterium]|nr:hypothetical protein [Candidatus Staskawiczbacteria bacterium]